jgi:dipeptidyl aminopeptidase/acylaminoacyl peptidase
MRRIAWGLTALLLGSTPCAAQDRRPLTWDDYYRVESPGQAAISPDGRRVAWVRSIALEAENRDHSEIWLSGAGGERAVRLTAPSTDASSPRWSPDGRLLAFSSRRPVAGETERGGPWFLRMDAPGEAFRIPGVQGTPIFDPTNRWIAFTRAVPPEGPKPSSPEPSSEAERRILERFDGRAYEWMQYRFDRAGYLPDPRDPWSTPPDQLFLVSRDGGEPRRLTDLAVDVRGVAWSPDGTALAFVADAHQRDEHTYERSDLWIVDLDGRVTRLTDDEYDYSSPSWSPDGRSLVVQGNVGLDVVIRERWDHGAPEDLFIFAVDGSGRRSITEHWDLIPGAPTWATDSWIYFTAGYGGATHLFRVRPTGGSAQQVTNGERRVGSVSFSADFSRIAYVSQSPVDPGNVFVRAPVDPDGAERRITDLNAGLLAELDLSSPERIEYESPDGTPIEGWLLPPAGWHAGDGRLWPMILNIHGGPHGAYGWEFSFDRHMQAAAGYFVLYTNPRASTGYGEAFRWGTWGSWGDEDYDDVMAGVDHVLGRWPIDESRMGVTGYSYGGYLTNWIVTQTDRFAAAASGAGISNWVSDYGTADIPRTKESEFFGPPWEEEGLRNLLASSPIVHAKGVTTPTLFVNGESDHRVPIEEAEQMYTALRKQGVPARMIRYPDSYHGGWTHWRYLHRLYSTLEWWGRWLGEKPIS